MLKNLLKNVQRPELDFSTLKKPRKPNTYLMSPPDYCLYPPKTISPIFDIPVQDLAATFEGMALSEPRTEKLTSREMGADLQVDYVQYSKLIGYPDTITARFIDLGEGNSTLAVFSRAHYGYRDFGVNEARVKDWMRKLDLAIKKRNHQIL
ncbi:MAG: DUF1499 domain-containing protein [Sneathiella sp.]